MGEGMKGGGAGVKEALHERAQWGVPWVLLEWEV